MSIVTRQSHTNRHASVNRKSPKKPQAYVKNYGQLTNTENKRNGLPQNKDNQLIFQYPILSPKNICTH